MNASYYRERAKRCCQEARDCHDFLIARMLDDLGREFEELAREIEARPLRSSDISNDTSTWPAVQHGSWRLQRNAGGPRPAAG